MFSARRHALHTDRTLAKVSSPSRRCIYFKPNRIESNRYVRSSDRSIVLGKVDSTNRLISRFTIRLVIHGADRCDGRSAASLPCGHATPRRLASSDSRDTLFTLARKSVDPLRIVATNPLCFRLRTDSTFLRTAPVRHSTLLPPDRLAGAAAPPATRSAPLPLRNLGDSIYLPS